MAEKEKKRFLSEAGGKELLSGILDLIEPIAEIVEELKNWHDSFPANDNQTWGVMNRKPEVIAYAGYDVAITPSVTAASLVLESWKKGYLVTKGADEEMLAEMMEILGEEDFNELAAKTVATQDIKPVPSLKELISNASEEYFVRKEQHEEMMRRMLEEAENVSAEELDVIENPRKGSSDVEPDKSI